MKKYWLAPLAFFLLGTLFIIINAPQVFALDENGCLSCHGNSEFSKTNVDGQDISLFINNEIVNTAAHRFIDCTTCHSDDPHSDPLPLTKLSSAQKCGTCHEYQYRLHASSIHGQQLIKNNQDVATCVDCHSDGGNPHGVIRVLEHSSPTFKKNIHQTCAKCHGYEELMETYGLVERVYESYMRSFHGKATELGTYELSQLDKATCTNCHGAHDIKSVNDPTSPVAGLDNLAATCETCHDGAGVEFAAGFLGHEEASPENIPVAHYAEKFFSTLMVSVIAFGVLIVTLAIVRYSRDRWKE
ncbi:cytochrome c3 family protein [Chloroflexota bacterium]